MVLLTVVLGGTIILTSILGVVSIAQNTKSLIFGFQSVMILLILAQAVISIQGIFHVTSHKVKLERETFFLSFATRLAWNGGSGPLWGAKTGTGCKSLSNAAGSMVRKIGARSNSYFFPFLKYFLSAGSRLLLLNARHR